ncbi:glycoside hydrolase domain-containing protein [Fodinicola acaciae]|uniref:glycoside hydrolase domain-containing protein n=1 Tax=Fodinicola acaciae TaxID=2681555 RepID=UPI0013D81103|nr:glycoside hydrolase domain-containing protein [Fodinicola acaciae]
MRRRFVGATTALVLGSTVLLGGAQEAAAAPANVWTETAYASVFKDSGPSADAGRAVRLDTGKNDYEAGQVVLRMDRAFSIERVDFSALRSGRDSIAASNLSYNFVGYEHLNNNSAFGTQDVNPVIRTAPGDFPDRLLNDRHLDVPAGQTQSIWVRAYVPATAAAGIYSGDVKVKTSSGDVRVPISVNVRDVTIPPSKSGDFTNVLWQLFTGNISYDEGRGDTVALYYKYNRYTDKWWNLIDNVAETMKRYRTNELSVPVVRLLIDGGSSVDDNGNYHFNWSRFDQVVERFMSHGGVKRLQGFWQSGRHGNDPPWYTEVIGKDSNGNAIRSFPETDTATTDKWLSQYVPALRQHIQAKGWAPIFQTQITDEPSSQYDEDHWKAMATKIRSYWPDIKIGDAIFSEPVASHLAPLNDIMIPEELNYNTTPAVYDAERKKGKDLWLYNCIIPVGNYLNRLIDQPEWNQRLTMWYAYSKNMNGYLHWAMNNWQYDIDAQASKGDGFIVRPDLVNNTVEVSPRYESLRDGIEDWEVLNILGKKNLDLARDLAAAVVQRADKYSPDTSYMQRIRALILDAAAGKPLSDVALFQNATASSQAAGFEAGKAVDGRSSTGWRPGGTGEQWLQVDLRRQAQVDGVRLHWGSAFAKSYQVQISYDGRQWATAYATTSGNGGDDFVGINGKARYVRVVANADTAYELTDLQVSGFRLGEQNLAGGKSYTKTYPDGTVATPSARFPDSGNEATDGLLGDAWDDGRAFGYELKPDQKITVNVTVDLGSVQRISEVRTHAYEEYPYYRPDLTTLSTSVDGVHFTPIGQLSAVNGESQVWYDFSFAQTKAKFVRLTFDKTGTPKASGIFIDDIEAYN